MKKYRIDLLIIVLVLSVFFGVSCSKLSNGEHIVDIYSTNDIHGKYFDSLYIGNQINKASLANISYYIKKVKKEGENPVLIDVGDHLQGDNAAYYFNYIDTIDEHIFSRAANYMGYDAIVVGNHDLETGHAVYDKVRRELKAPYLAANAIITEGENKGQAYFDRYVIVKRGRVKIAIIGMTNPNIKNWLSPDLWSGMAFVPLQDITQDLVNEVIEKEQPHIVVIAAHVGKGTGVETDIENSAKFMAKTLKGVDIIFCAHDHRKFNKIIKNPNGNILVMNSGSVARLLSHAKVILNVKNGKVVSKNIESKFIATIKAPVDYDYLKYFREDFEKVKAFTTISIGYLKETINSKDALYGPSSYLNFIHTVQLKSSEAQISFAAPLTITNIVREGTLTYQDLFSLYPYENQLYVINMTGKQIKDYLEYSYSIWINKKGPFFNYASADGIIYEVSRSSKDGNRVRIKSMCDGTVFDENMVYKVAITSYRANGGGDILRLGAGIDPEKLDEILVAKHPEVRALIFDYIVNEREIYPKASTNWNFVI